VVERPVVDTGGLVTGPGVPSVRRAMPGVLQEPVCDAENDRRLDRSRERQTA
jgi:hypothetical protein